MPEERDELESQIAELSATVAKQERTIKALERKTTIQDRIIIEYADFTNRQTEKIPAWLRQDMENTEKWNEVREARARMHEAMNEYVHEKEEFDKVENPTAEEIARHEERSAQFSKLYFSRLAEARVKENELAETPAHTHEKEDVERELLDP